MRVATWNVNCFNHRRAADKLRLLDLEDWDVALLQEVNEDTFECFAASETSFRGKWAVDLLGQRWSKPTAPLS